MASRTVAPEATAVMVSITSHAERRGLTTKALLEKAGLRGDWLDRVNEGNHDPRLSELSRLGAELGVGVGELLVAPPKRPKSKRSKRDNTSPLAMPVALVAVLNGSVDEATAFVFWPDDDSRALSDAIHRPIRAFAREAAAQWRDPPELLHEYPSRQARAHLMGAMCRKNYRAKGVGVWVPADKRSTALERVARFLLQTKERPLEDLLLGTRKMATAYEEVVGILAEADRTSSTAKERSQFVHEMHDAFTSVASAGRG